ncbi:MAG: helix-turn-helix domain-containing protein [Enterococcus sp.]|nr:helix-turn-helix domain-containing protein [Enterococcus sp.]
MDNDQLNDFLFTYTTSEIKHMKENSPKTHRYNSINTQLLDGKSVYVFNYHSLLDKSSIAVMKNSRFMSIPLHIHNVIEINYVYEGCCKQTINGQFINMEKGDICILDTNVPHQIDMLNDKDIVLNIIMDKSYFDQSFFNRWSQQNVLTSFLINALDKEKHISSFLFFKSPKNRQIHDYIKTICCEYFSPEICSQEIIDSLMTLVFSELIRAYSDHQTEIYSEKNDIIKIFKYIEKNYKDCSLESIAKEFNFHPNYMSQFIKQKTGVTFKDLLIAQRISEAKLLLQYSNESIFNISRSVGYENTGFFYQKFKSIVGVPPKEFRLSTSRVSSN